jgi:uncharacterized protein (TIGR00269 family)
MRRHNATFCEGHFVEHVHRQVERTIHDYRMFTHEDHLLLGVSGGKDSLALWVDGVNIELGIDEYSTDGTNYSRRFAEERGLRLREVDLARDFGFTIPEAARSTSRNACSACGLSKRYILNDATVNHGYDVLVMGHNLDDEAATLLSNVTNWNMEYLARQRPVLPATTQGLARKVKPLIRVAERETAAYAIIRGIEYEVEECPLAGGNTLNKLKEYLDILEDRSIGSKQRLLFGFFDRGATAFQELEGPELSLCESCTAPTTGEVCAFCRLVDRTKAKKGKL